MKLNKIVLNKSIQTLQHLSEYTGNRGRAFYNLVKNSKA
jgi:hypothetical protein